MSYFYNGQPLDTRTWPLTDPNTGRVVIHFNRHPAQEVSSYQQDSNTHGHNESMTTKPDTYPKRKGRHASSYRSGVSQKKLQTQARHIDFPKTASQHSHFGSQRTEQDTQKVLLWSTHCRTPSSPMAFSYQ